jgi:hypothetical protein
VFVASVPSFEKRVLRSLALSPCWPITFSSNLDSILAVYVDMEFGFL